jgi:hypothetical protein
MSQIKRAKLVLATSYTTSRADDDLIPDVILFHGKSKEFARQVIIDAIQDDVAAMQNDAWVSMKYIYADADTESELIPKAVVIDHVSEALEKCDCVSFSFTTFSGENVENVYCIHTVMTV